MQLIMVHFVKSCHLVSRIHMRANTRLHHLDNDSFRVMHGEYDEDLAAAAQSKEAVWHAATKKLHINETTHPAVKESVLRMEYVGQKLFEHQPGVYSKTKFIFMTNRYLEKFGRDEHNKDFVVGEPWCYYDGVDVLHEHPAVKCTADGVSLPYPGCIRWDGRLEDESGGRQFVGGSVACDFQWKVGLELRVGTFPNNREANGIAVKEVPPIYVGKPSRKQKLKPGKRIIPISLGHPSMVGGKLEPGLLVECPDYQPDDGCLTFPTATMPMYVYKSQTIKGRVNCN